VEHLTRGRVAAVHLHIVVAQVHPVQEVQVHPVQEALAVQVEVPAEEVEDKARAN